MKNTLKTIGLTAVAALALTACGGGSNDGGDNYTPHPYDAPPISEADKNAYLNAVNAARSVGRSCGSLGWFDAVPPLQWSDALYKAAYEHSQDMAATGVLTHSGSGTETDWTAQVQELGRGSNSGDRGRNNGATTQVDENAAKGYNSLASVMAAWLASDGHCVTIMFDGNKHEQRIGMARVGSFWSLEIEEVLK